MKITTIRLLHAAREYIMHPTRLVLAQRQGDVMP